MDTYFVEVTSENSKQYFGKILKLQDEVFEHLKAQEKQHLFFRSSEEEIREYINSEDSIVYILTHGENIASVCYFTFNHSVYNDLTLYIKNSNVYKEFAFSYYSQATLIAEYIQNVFIYKLLKEKNILTDDLLNKIREKAKNNDFFENDPLRQEISKILKDNKIFNDEFYPWIVSNDLPELTPKSTALAQEYDEFISYFQYKYVVSPKELTFKLQNLSDKNVGELDTYFSAPQYRNQGYASTLIDQAIRKAISRKNILAISATVHPDNLVSQHILKNLGFEKFCTVERRKDVTRDVMFKIIN